MQAAILRVLPSARQSLTRPERFGLSKSTHLRIRTRSRCFSQTTRYLQNPGDSSRPTDPNKKTPKSREPKSNNESTAGEVTTGTKAASEGDQESGIPEGIVDELLGANGGEAPGDRPIRQRGRPVGTKSRRPQLTKTDIPKPVLPKWFIKRNVGLREDNKIDNGAPRLGLFSHPTPPDNANLTPVALAAEVEENLEVAESVREKQDKKEKEDIKEDIKRIEKVDDSDATSGGIERYRLHQSVWDEILTQIRTGLLIPKGPFMDSLASMRSHCLLYLLKEGGAYYLDALVDKLATTVDADMIRMDAQDLAEIAGDYLGDSRHSTIADISSVGIRSLGYDTQLFLKESELEEEDYEATGDTYEEDDSAVVEPPEVHHHPNILPLNVLKRLLGDNTRISAAAILPIGAEFFAGVPSKELIIDNANERKMNILLEAMISSAQSKRAARKGESQTTDAISDLFGKTLVHIRDYRELERTKSGRAVLKMLLDIIQDRRIKGEQIMLLGTSSSQETTGVYSKAGVKSLQATLDDISERTVTIVVPTESGKAEDEIFKYDLESRVREVNIRHLRDVIRRRSGENGEAATLDIPEDWHRTVDEESEKAISGISDKVWNFEEVHRVATVALGASGERRAKITVQDIGAAIQTIERSDEIKFDWAVREGHSIKERLQSENTENDKPKSRIPKNLTTHEKKLVGGIIEPSDIKTGFSSIRAPPETIQAMKTLTSLSLIRPEAFKYGVLASDRIPGVLLYGPPGTGKTLLAKAVAKESGATVLDVSGADIADMFVGESEKNVKAVFSLAKKLSPCVVFIDEADAIFGSRQSSSNRSSHRETINQFLKEWADMTSTAFIMVATNRPFDLDDAVLRRLPRRILIDLPTEEDRYEILRIHLVEEHLDENIDLRELASRTSLYSGSDLKNICVSAALACVHEESVEFEKTGSYPAKRTLRKHHFEKAMNEITASISDDMGTLTLIRKFDDKYGERAGRKKTKKEWGFELGQSDSKQQGEGRVRLE